MRHQYLLNKTLSLFVIDTTKYRLSYAQLGLSSVVLSVFVLVFLLIFQQVGDLSYLTATRAKSIEVQCPLQKKSCVIETSEGRIKLSAARGIQSLVPFTITLNSEIDKLKSAKIVFVGFDDYMGINTFEFVPSLYGDKQWVMKGSIPICTSESNTWRVIVNLQLESAENKNAISSYWFKLKTP